MNKLEVNVAMCEVCDNYTPRLYVEEFEQECCELCYNAYGDCNQLSQVCASIQIDKKRDTMKTPTDLLTLQKQYDMMVRLAKECNYDITDDFERELTQLMRLVKSMGGKI